MQTVALLFDHGSEVATISHTYDGMGRLTQIRHGDIAQYDFSWDAANRITSMNDAEYGYDQTSQLVSAEYDKLPSEAYEYDANGNRKNFETGKNNQLLSDGVFDYKYDDEGNRVAKQSKDSLTCYEWDHRNRLIRVIDNGKSVEYAYDYQNRLVRRNDELFVHDGWQIACSLKNGKVEHRYLWGATQDELIACDDQWMLRDHLSTVRKVVNAKGAVVSKLEYNAFGVLINATGDKPLFRYTGKMFDDATGLQWNINRWYDASVGRWISEDPIGFGGGDGNLFRYVNNSPIERIDFSGLSDGFSWVNLCKQLAKIPFAKKIMLGAAVITIYEFCKPCLQSPETCDTNPPQPLPPPIPENSSLYCVYRGMIYFEAEVARRPDVQGRCRRNCQGSWNWWCCNHRGTFRASAYYVCTNTNWWGTNLEWRFDSWGEIVRECGARACGSGCTDLGIDYFPPAGG